MNIEELQSHLREVIAEIAEQTEQLKQLKTQLTAYEDSLEEQGAVLLEAKKASELALAHYQQELEEYNKADTERLGTSSLMGIVERKISDLESDKETTIKEIEAKEKANEEQKQAIIEQLKEITEGK